jgi:hypothetical protein
MSDGIDVVAVAAPPGASEDVTRALMSRARQKGCVLLPTTVWSGCDLVIELVERRWSGRHTNALRNQADQQRAVPVQPSPAMAKWWPPARPTPAGSPPWTHRLHTERCRHG